MIALQARPPGRTRKGMFSFCSLLLAMFLAILFFSWTGTQTEENDLEQFFDCLIHDSSIGYTLCGQKPVAIETFPSLSKLSITQTIRVVFFHFRRYRSLWKGINSWMKCCEQYPSEKFVIRWIPEKNTLVLVNRSEVKKIIEDHLDLFHLLGNPDASIEQIYEDVCFAKQNEYLVGYPALLGILLGYGRENSLAFANPETRKQMQPFTFPEGRFRERGFLNLGFMMLPDEVNSKENEEVRIRCLEDREKLIQQFQEGSAFEKWMDLFLFKKEAIPNVIQ